MIRRLEPDEKTPGGILLPDNSREKPVQGRVLSVGDGRLLPNGNHAQHQVREGDRVLFNRYSGTEVDVDGESLLIIDEAEILAVVP
jgi:chaperonin GroES